MQLFGPNTSDFSAKDSDPVSRNVTVPLAVEIVKPAAQLLEQILPVGPTPTPASFVPSGNTFVDAMRNKSNQAHTANGAETHKSTTSAVLDAFCSLNENSPAQAFHKMLAASWNESPKLTLRIIWNIRSIPEGQNDKPGFYRAFGWLYKNHPRTALENLRCVTEKLCQRKIDHKPTRIGDDGFVLPDTDDETTEQIIKVPHGYFKDLLNIIVLAMHGQLGDPAVEEFTCLKTPPMERKERRSQTEWKAAMAAKKEENARLTVDEAKKLRKARAEESATIRAKEAKNTRNKRHEDNFALLAHKLAHDRPFRALYSLVAQTFAEELAKDLIILKQIESASEAEALNLELELSSAGKWAPALDGFHDRITNISTAIALVLHARGHMSDLGLALSPEVTQKQATILRSYYRRWVLCPLRRFLDVPEIKMSAGQWNKIDYERISDKCMQKNQHLFMKYDEERFTKFLRDVTTGKRKIRHESLLPHRILMSALGIDGDSSGVMPRLATKKTVDDLKQETRQKISVALWNSLVEQMQSSGTLENALAIVDVSGSMGTLEGGRSIPYLGPKRVPPIFPAVALGILLATIAKPPFNNMFITFTAEPEFVSLPPGNLVNQAQHMSRSNWTVNTDYEAVFLNLILPTAIENNVKPEHMPKRLFVFSDMQFDQSLSENIRPGWETTHDRVVKAYSAAGYEVPEIVYWNLAGGCSTHPVLKDTPGTAMVTGFAANMMRLFMMGKVTDQTSMGDASPDREPRDTPRVIRSGPMTPMEIMQRALSKPCYDPLQVHD